MTYCNTLIDPLKERIEVEKKSLDTIAKELCGDTVKNPRQKVIRLIKILLGEDILIKNAETLGYDAKKAVRIAADHGKIVSEKDVEESDNSGQTNSVMPPISSCQTAVQPVKKEQVGDAGQCKGQEQVSDVSIKPAVCSRSSNRVRTVNRIIHSETKTEQESGDMKEPEQIVEELDEVPVIKVPKELLMEIKKLINLFFLEAVKKAFTNESGGLFMGNLIVIPLMIAIPTLIGAIVIGGIAMLFIITKDFI